MSQTHTRWDKTAARQHVVVALIIERRARSRLTGSLAPRFHVRFCDLASEFALLALDPRCAVLIAEPRDAAGVSVAPTIARLTRSPRALPILGYVPIGPTPSHDILEIAKSGIHGLIRADVDDSGVALSAAVSAAGRACAAESVASSLRAALSPGALEIVSRVLARAEHALTVADLAELLEVDRRTLHRRFVRVGLPGPQKVIGWCRLLVASRFLADEGRSLESVAYLLDFPSAPALRNMLVRYAGLRPKEIRDAGSRDVVMERFVAACVEPRRVEVPAIPDAVD